MTRSRRSGFSALLLSILVVLVPAQASALPAEGPIFIATGEDCRNFTVSLDDMDPAVAREMTPERFELTDPPSGFVEMATCPTGKVNGTEIGAYTIAEAAISIEPPADIEGTSGAIEQDIFALSQLDTNATLSEVKSDAGYASDVIDIGFEYDPGPPQQIEGTIPWPFSPYTMSAEVFGGAPVPAASIITRIWTAGPKGVVVTENNIYDIAAGSTGFSTAHFEPGSPLAKLAGSDTVSGNSISGVGSFENRAFLIEDGVRLKARTIQRRKAARIRAVGADGPVFGIVRRGADGEGRRVKTRKGRGNRLVWAGNGRGGRPVASGTYTIVVKAKASRQELGSVGVRVTKGKRLSVR